MIRALVVVAFAAAVTIVATAPSAHADVRCLGACVAEINDVTPRAAGAIGLIGDSVLIGVDPWIDGDLAGAGWGPIWYWAGTGTRVPADNPLGASSEMRRMRAAGFDPPVWIIGVGADDVGFVGSSRVASEQEIDLMLDEIGPGRDTIMATIQHHNPVWEANWNAALRAVATRRPELHVVEWQAEADQHPSWWGGDGVHLSPTGYQARSQMLTAATLPLQAAHRSATTVPTIAPIGGPLTFAPVATTRVLDTRAGGSRLAVGETRSIDLSAVVPGSARAATVNLTVDTPSGDGYLTAYACGTPPPLASNLNYTSGAPRGAAATVALDASRHLCVATYAATDLIVDVSGAYTPDATGGRFTPATPTRVLDTRSGSRPAAAAVSVVPVPAGATAVTLNLTATNAADPGFLTAYPCGGSRPVASNVNVGAGQSVANLAVVPVAGNASVCVFASGRTDVVVDLLGTYGPGGLRYQAVTPVRLLDTRAGTGGWSGRPAAFQRLDLPPVPGATAMSFTLTTVTPAADGYATVYPCGGTPPLASNLNYVGWSAATANSATIASPACVVAQARSHAVVDLAGYWVA